LNRALITGAGGQDGSLLAELLLEMGYEVVGVLRDAGLPPNLAGVAERLQLLSLDLLDQQAVAAAIRETQPSEIYNLASMSFVPASWQKPVETARITALAVSVLLEAIREADAGIRFFQASSSAIFGEPVEVPQTESTPLSPNTPYGAAKAHAHFLTRFYRRQHGLHASAGILYNHESPRRPEVFLPSKVARAAARIAAGLDRELVLGDLDARRDWGYAPDYVRAMWLMLQQEVPDEFVICTGETHTVAQLAELAFRQVGLDWREHVRSDPSLQRGQAQQHHLVGDPSRAISRLGWTREVGFEALVRLLVDAEVARLQPESRPL
jgi:GDPmannose 4,6-dehydratase